VKKHANTHVLIAPNERFDDALVCRYAPLVVGRLPLLLRWID